MDSVSDVSIVCICIVSSKYERAHAPLPSNYFHFCLHNCVVCFCSMWFRLFSELLQLIQWLYLSQPSALPAVAQYLVNHLDGVVVDGHKTGKPLPSMASLWEGIQQTISPRIPPFLCFSKERMLMMPSDIDSDTPFDQVSLLPLLSRLDAHSLLVLYTAMLCERRIVFVSRYLSTLSACVHGALSLLYPMTWQVRLLSFPNLAFVCFIFDDVHAILVVCSKSSSRSCRARCCRTAPRRHRL